MFTSIIYMIYGNSIVIEKCFFTNILANVIICTTISSITYCKINNSKFSFGDGAVSRHIAYSANNIDLLSINNCEITFDADGTNYVVYSNNITNSNISNCYIAYPSAILYNVTSLQKVIVENNYIANAFGSPALFSLGAIVSSANINNNVISTSGIFGYSSGIISDSFFSNHVVTSTDMTRILQVVAFLWNSYFCNNSFITTGALTSGITCGGLSLGLHIDDNIFSFSGTSSNGDIIYFVSYLNYSTINHNVFISSATMANGRFIDIDHALYCKISGNYFSLLAGSADAAIKLTSPENTCITDNNIINTSIAVVSAATNAIQIANTSRYTIVSNNKIINGGENVGFGKAILFDGGTGVIGADHFYDIISYNDISYFYGTTTTRRGIKVKNGDNTLIHGNKMLTVEMGIDGYDCKFPIISDNSINSTGSANLGSALVMDGSSALFGLTVVQINIINNVFSNWDAIVGAPLCHIASGSNLDLFGVPLTIGVISNNCFMHGSLCSSAYSLLKVNGGSYLISNNRFVGGTYTTEYPLYVSAKYCRVFLNDVQYVFSYPVGGSGHIYITDSTSRGYKNWGEFYATPIDISVGISPATAAQWMFNSAVILGTGTIYWHGNATAEQLTLHFAPTEGLPIGALISEIKMRYRVDENTANTRITAIVMKKQWDDDTYSVIQSFNFDGTNSVIETATFTGLTEFQIQAGYSYYLFFLSVDDGSPVDKYIYGIKASYKL